MTQNIKIYRVKKEDYRFEKLKSREKIIELIIQLIRKKLKIKEKFEFSGIPKFEENQIKYYLYVHNYSEKQSDWANFFPHQLTGNLQFDILNISLFLFVDNGIDIFIIVGGRGFQLIVPFIDHTFGLTVYSKIINPVEDMIISINSRGLTGARSGISEQFRNEFRLIDLVRFGKVPISIHLTLSKRISDEYFSFLQKKIDERIKIYVGKAFKIKKSLDFIDLHKVIIELGFILELEGNDYLSSYIEVKDPRQIDEELQPLLMQAIYNDLSNVGKTNETGDKRFKFDFCNPNNMVAFYEAEYYVLKEKIGKGYSEFKRVNNREEIYEAVLSRALEEVGDNDFFNFRAFINGVRIAAYSESGRNPASSGFIYHFTSEFLFNNQAVFLVDTRWYKLKPSFVEDLKYECVQTIKAYSLPKDIFKMPWDKSKIKTEGEYNLQYNGKEKYIVLDTFTPDGIELCDVMYIEDETVYMIHVKYGFYSPIRELVNQITLSAQRLYEDLKSPEKEYLNKIYRSVTNNENCIMPLSKEEFIKSFDKKIVYVLAFASQLSSDLLVEENIDKYTSNIARYSLVQCSREMQTFKYQLNIRQIRRN